MSLDIRRCAFGHRHRTILADVTFSVQPGEVVALLGPNGCGKTTLFRTLLGAIPPLEGRMEVDGADLASLPARDRARRLAYVPQFQSAVFPFRALDVVALGRFAHLGPLGAAGEKDREAARQALERADALHLADRPVTELSGGEKQRVLIARALAQDAPYLLLDEPTSHLDFGHAHHALDLVRSLAAEGRGILWTAHDPIQVLRAADRAVVLHAGKVHAQGDPAEILSSRLFEDVFGVRLDGCRSPIPSPWKRHEEFA